MINSRPIVLVLYVDKKREVRKYFEEVKLMFGSDSQGYLEYFFLNTEKNTINSLKCNFFPLTFLLMIYSTTVKQKKLLFSSQNKVKLLDTNINSLLFRKGCEKKNEENQEIFKYHN